MFKLFTLVSVIATGSALAQVVCEDITNWRGKGQNCRFPQMISYNQQSASLPASYSGKDIVKNTACGPTAVASLYSVINANPYHYYPESDTLPAILKDKDAYKTVIPHVYVSIGTNSKIGTLPFNMYSYALPGRHLNSGKSFYSFLSSRVMNSTAESYFTWVKDNKMLMSLLVGFYEKKCLSVLGITKCFYVIPSTLHYQALSGANSFPLLFFRTGYNLKYYNGDGYGSYSTSLAKEEAGCKSRGWFNICTNSLTLPFLASHAMYYTDSNESKRTFLHGFFGLYR
jgi:hypothetical protein